MEELFYVSRAMRYAHIDIARGIAIILVVLGHCCQSTDIALNRVILSFHMPLFFFLSGVFAKSETVKTIMGGVFLKAKKLLIPQVTLSVTIIILKGSIWLSEGKNLSDFDFFACFGFWFLPVLFLCSICYMTVFAIIDLHKAQFKVVTMIIAMSLSVILILNHVDSEIIPVDWLIKSTVAVPFYFGGSFFKERVLKVSNEQRIYDNMLLILLLPIIVIVSQINSPVLMYKNEYGMIPLFFITSVLGIVLVVELSKRLVNMPVLIEFGKLSIAVYVWNFLIVGFSVRVLNRIMLMLGLDNEAILTAATFSISMIILYLLSKWTYNKLPYLYGLK